MTIIVRIYYNERWWKWCTIDEDDATNEDFNNDKAFKNEDDNNKCDDRWMNKIFQIECNADVNKIFMHFNDFHVWFSQFSAIVDIYFTFF